MNRDLWKERLHDLHQLGRVVEVAEADIRRAIITEDDQAMIAAVNRWHAARRQTMSLMVDTVESLHLSVKPIVERQAWKSPLAFLRNPPELAFVAVMMVVFWNLLALIPR